MTRKEQINFQLQKDLKNYLLSELEKDINVDLSTLKYGQFSFSFSKTFMKLKDNYVYATSGFTASYEIYLHEKITIGYGVLGITFLKRKKNVLSRFGELVIKNYKLRKEIKEQEEIDKIMETIPDKDQFIRKIKINDILNNK